MNVLLSENQFCIFLHHENANFCSYAFSQKPPIGRKSGRKNNFPIKTFKNIRIWNKFLTTCQTLNQEFQNLPDFYSTPHNSSFFETEILQRVGFWNIFFTTRQILNRNFNNTTVFLVKLFLKNQTYLDKSLSKNFLLSGQFTPEKCQKWRFLTFMGSLFLRALFLQ